MKKKGIINCQELFQKKKNVVGMLISAGALFPKMGPSKKKKNGEFGDK